MTSSPPAPRAGAGRRWALVGVAGATSVAAMALGRGATDGAMLAVLTGYGALGLLLALERRWPVLRMVPVLVVSGGLLAAAVAFPPLSSDDVWTYAAWGRLAADGRSPYTHTPADLGEGDPVLARADPLWAGTSSVYGAAFTALSAVVMKAVGTNALAARLAFQGLAALAVALALVLVARRTGDPWAVALVGLNPLVVVSLVNGGHNDALLAVGVLAGALLAERGRWVAAGAVLGLAASVKLVVLLPVVAVAVWVARREGVRRAGAVAGVAVLVVAGSYALVGGTAALRPVLRAGQELVAPASPWHPVRVAMGAEDHVPDPAVDRRISRLASLLVAGVAGTVIIAASRRRPAPVVAGSAALAFTLLAPYVLDWYPAWALPALAVGGASVPVALAAGQGALLHLVYVGDPSSGLLGPAQDALRDTLLPLLQVVAAGALVAFAGRRREGATPTRWFPAASR